MEDGCYIFYHAHLAVLDGVIIHKDKLEEQFSNLYLNIYDKLRFLYIFFFGMFFVFSAMNKCIYLSNEALILLSFMCTSIAGKGEI